VTKTTEVAVVGAGPAGLSAAIAARRAGARVMVVDENSRPGGQLVKQTHKFFGSRDHFAGVRGIDIARRLAAEAEDAGVDIQLDTAVWGIFEGPVLGLARGKSAFDVAAKKVILACGATENAINFPGWTLPGVMGAGAAQTMVNLHRVLPGKRFLMVGSGNVGLIVSYQLLQAGAEVAAVVEAAGRIGGYAVHAAKLTRNSVPILVRHTVIRAEGRDHVEKAVVARVDHAWKPVPGSERTFDVDVICIAAGLSPLAELAWMAGARFEFVPRLGGFVPLHDENMSTTCPDIYIAGDISGVEEASTAMEEGQIAGLAAAQSLGYKSKWVAEQLEAARANLAELRRGPFGDSIAVAKRTILDLFHAVAEMPCR